MGRAARAHVARRLGRSDRVCLTQTTACVNDPFLGVAAAERATVDAERMSVRWRFHGDAHAASLVFRENERPLEYDVSEVQDGALLLFFLPVEYGSEPERRWNDHRAADAMMGECGNGCEVDDRFEHAWRKRSVRRRHRWLRRSERGMRTLERVRPN